MKYVGYIILSHLPGCSVPFLWGFIPCGRTHLSNPLLLIVLVVNGAAVLRPCIVPLPVLGGGVMDAVEILYLQCTTTL